MHKVYIIILNYNNWADTIECLESVLRNDYPNYQVIVVDDNSPNDFRLAGLAFQLIEHGLGVFGDVGEEIVMIATK